MAPMRRTVWRSVRLVAVGAIVTVAVAACGDDDDSAPSTAATAAPSTAATAVPSTAPPATSGGSGPAGTAGAVDLSACPNPIVIQTNWFPEAEHGGLYEMVGPGYKVDTDKKVVRGPLVAHGGSTGRDIEIRAGGPAIGNQPVSVQQYADDSITLGYANTEGQVLRASKTPVLSVVAPLEKNPQIIFWDPATYPDVKTLADLGTKGITINIFAGGTFADVFVAEGIWKKSQIDASYDGSPARFIAEDGKIAQQGFASAEPYTYQHEYEEWGKPVAYQTLDDAGFKVYPQTLSIVPDRKAELAPCLQALVPVIQQAQIDYLADPAAANAIIIDAVKRYDTFWTYDQGLADYSVKTQREQGFVGNGPDSTLGNMDGARIQGVIDQIRDAGLDVPATLQASDLFTNEFVDPSIGLG
jgi:hypothetical protein